MPSIAIPVSLRGQLLYSTRIFDPLSLFAANEPGIWLDPSDLTTMFQDRAGSTAVTTPGQSVGLRLDKSKGLVLGPELVVNGGFATDTDWTKGAGWTISGGVATTAAATSGNLDQTMVLVAGRAYLINYTVTGWVSGQAVPSFGGGTAVFGALSGASNGVKSCVMFAATGNTSFRITKNASADSFSIDNISVKELPGNHAVANSDAARGIYGIEPLGGRRNLLTRTEEFDNAAWIKASGATVSANAVISPDGTQNADTLICPNSSDTTPDVYVASLAVTSGVTYTFSVWLKGASNGAWPLNVYNGASHNPLVVNVTTEWQRFVVTVVASGTTMNVYLCDKRSSVSGSNTYLDSVDAYGAQLETGSTATAYQRVTTQYDVTEAGKQTLHYVQYDGSDDGYVTPTITPGTDKVQVFAGVRKLSDAATGVVAETGAGVLQSVRLFAPRSAAQNYAFGSSGSVLVEATGTGFAAPISNVITGLGDISGDNATLRVNGVQVAQVTADQGTGNYGNLPLYIGRRGGTTLPFNGRDYGIITRFGANLDASTIAATESWLNQRTGAF